MTIGRWLNNIRSRSTFFAPDGLRIIEKSDWTGEGILFKRATTKRWQVEGPAGDERILHELSLTLSRHSVTGLLWSNNHDGIGPDDPGRGTKKIVYWTYQKMTVLLQHWDGKPPERLRLGTAVVGYRFRMSHAADGSILVMWLDQTAERIKQR